MKEFIEKLIGRLEELPTKAITRYKGGTFGDYEGTDYFIDKYKTKDIINELTEEYKGGWISVTERLPDNKTSVLICSGEFVHEAYFEDGNFSNEYGMWYKSVTHWQPLPEPFRTEKAEWKDKVMIHFTKVE